MNDYQRCSNNNHTIINILRQECQKIELSIEAKEIAASFSINWLHLNTLLCKPDSIFSSINLVNRLHQFTNFTVFHIRKPKSVKQNDCA